MEAMEAKYCVTPKRGGRFSRKPECVSLVENRNSSRGGVLPRMRTLLGSTVLMLSAFCSFAGSLVVGYTNASVVRHFSQSTMADLGRFKWFFAHASVGGNIMEGINLLHMKDPTFYPLKAAWAGTGVPSATSPGTIYEQNRGNPGWLAKVDGFTNFIAEGWCSPTVDIVMNKFCWIDSDANFEYYVNSTSGLEAMNLRTWVVYATIPLTSSEEPENYDRTVFNTRLREWVRANNRILYDIADIEAHDTNGLEQTFLSNGRVAQKQFAGYTSDGGHLTTAQAQELAASGLYALAAGLLTLDRDDDGMPDFWEMANGLNPVDAADAAADRDSDGMSNLQEYVVGTDRFLRLRVSGLDDAGLRMDFYAASNVAYSVEFCADPRQGSWQSLTNIPASSAESTISVVEAAASTNSMMFYRLSARRGL